MDLREHRSFYSSELLLPANTGGGFAASVLQRAAGLADERATACASLCAKHREAFPRRLSGELEDLFARLGALPLSPAANWLHAHWRIPRDDAPLLVELSALLGISGVRFAHGSARSACADGSFSSAGYVVSSGTRSGRVVICRVRAASARFAHMHLREFERFTASRAVRGLLCVVLEGAELLSATTAAELSRLAASRAFTSARLVKSAALAQVWAVPRLFVFAATDAPRAVVARGGSPAEYLSLLEFATLQQGVQELDWMERFRAAAAAQASSTRPLVVAQHVQYIRTWLHAREEKWARIDDAFLDQGQEEP